MKKLLLVFLLALPWIHACGDHQSSPVQLNQGQRWKANPETTAGIAAMQAILTKYEGRTGDSAGRTALREELESAFQDIFKKCTMTGEAHDQLHNYLIPIQALLKKVNSETESQNAIGELTKYLATYQDYFE